MGWRKQLDSKRGLGKHKLSLLDRMRGWHWEGTDKVRNWCGCLIEKGK